MKRIAILAFCLSCTPSVLTPPTGPGTDLPCGYHGRSCGNGKCCDMTETCGAEHTSCPAEMCCYQQDLADDDGRLFGAKKPRPQTKER
jgi:hypothetical protein